MSLAGYGSFELPTQAPGFLVPEPTVRQGVTGGGQSGSAGAILAPMGFNPLRSHRRDLADLVMLFAALAVCVALLAWAVFG